ncbi:MAG: MbnP family protein, partial [Bacteroidota bacterium]
ISQGDSLYPVSFGSKTYFSPSGDSFSIENLSFILSDFHLIDLEGEEVPVFDSLFVRTINAQRDSVFYSFSNSFLIGNPNLFQKKKVAAIFHNGLGVKTLRFTLGVKPPVNVLTPSEFPPNHPLVVNQSYLYQKEKGYIFANMQLKRKAFPLESMINISLSGNDFLNTIEVPIFTKVKAGYHQEITLEVDYAKWFNGLDFSKDPPEIIRKKWMVNLVNSFKIVSVLEVID